MLLALLVTAQVAAAEPATSTGRHRPCATVVVGSPQAPHGAMSAFSVTKILDLELRAYLRPLPAGPHVVELKLYTPRGHLYEVLPVAFERTRSKKIVLRPVAARLPVAGTSIVTASLFGRWRVDVHLDGAPQSCGTATHFRLTP